MVTLHTHTLAAVFQPGLGVKDTKGMKRTRLQRKQLRGHGNGVFVLRLADGILGGTKILFLSVTTLVWLQGRNVAEREDSAGSRKSSGSSTPAHTQPAGGHMLLSLVFFQSKHQASGKQAGWRSEERLRVSPTYRICSSPAKLALWSPHWYLNAP